MARKKKRSWKVPKILWRIFNEKARNLATTITCIIPPPPSQPFPITCRCQGRSCLQCCEDPISFLLRPDDPLDYKKLLHDCFVVVNDDAPFLEFNPDRHWSQKQIVGRVIEMMLFQRPKPCNLICTGYNKLARSSMIVELLTSSAWDILLERVGDECMVYLLWHTSIFLPLSHKKHLQVAGSPINKLCKKLSNNETKPKSGAGKKRKGTDNSISVSKRQQCSSLPSYDIDFAGSRMQEAVAKSSNGELQRRSSQTAEKHKKFYRPFDWKRQKRHRQLNIPECRHETISRTIFSDESCLPGNLKSPSNISQMPVQCSCYLMLKPPQLFSHWKEINRQSMFYNLECSSSVLPQEHLLNTLVPNFSSSKRLMENIFCLSDANVSGQSAPCSHDSDFCLVGSSCLYHSFLKLLKMLIRRSRRCKSLKLLEKYCPLSSFNEKAMGKSSTIVESNVLDKGVLKESHGVGAKEYNKILEADSAQLESTKPYCLQSQVGAFIWAVCRSIVPPDLLGTPFNWRILRRNISKFIRLRRFEKFSMKQCMHQLKRSDFPFLSNNHTSCCLNGQVPKNGTGQKKFSEAGFSIHDIKHKLFVNWIFWFFSSLVVPLVQANFYVTESEHGKQDVFYYRKPVWEKFTDHAITCLKDRSYLELDEAAVRAIIDKRPFGFSRLRLCPKQNGARMLANLKASSRMLDGGSCSKHRCSWMHRSLKACSRKVKSKRFKSVNSVLRGTHAVLKGLLLKEPEKLGSSVFDYNDVYRKLCPFLTTLKNVSTTVPGLFVVVADVSKAFDSIDQDKLLSIMEDVITKDEYHLQQIRQVGCSSRCLWDYENLMLVDETVNTGSNLMSSVPVRSLSSILVNQGCSRLLKKEELFSNLYEHVKRNVLQLDKKFYLQGMGIPQGSMLSSLLCSLYYGYMEKHEIFPYLEKTFEPAAEVLSARHVFSDASDAQNSSEDALIFPPTYLLLRFIDDFLFISTSKEQASGFLSMLRRGFPDYNCYMNEEKFCLNFDIERQAGLLSNRIYVVDDGTSFLRWSGLLINCCSLEIQGDYTRYLDNHLSSTLTVRWQGKPGNYLKKKLCGFTRPRCHPLFFDLNINSASVVRLNIYQAFLLSAMKFHRYVSEISDIFKPLRRYCLKIIERSFRYMQRLIGKRMGSSRLGSGLSPVLKLMKEEVVWLGLNAYIKVLKRKQSRHRVLLSMLRCKYFAHRITGNESSELRYAVERSHSSSLWKIEY
ncbi:telomerase reverse transcriptase isoform X1 [Herrania umbratica]|uniref:Telomerase reverse transcriptase n=1 Tax=Herrania umbratica TaxID=108875 RepID=A0A6J1BBI6_9ROSI|nr:telomerase reverse transcriptase isoform X1 [Herrania umbratica]